MMSETHEYRLGIPVPPYPFPRVCLAGPRPPPIGRGRFRFVVIGWRGNCCALDGQCQRTYTIAGCIMTGQRMGKRSPLPVDMVVGQNIRAARLNAGLSQTELAQACGVTFQQVQKYENGVNRVGGSRPAADFS